MADNLCPVCHAPAVMRCRCFRADSRCASGHDWHTCTVHGVIVSGASDHATPTTDCTCPGREFARVINRRLGSRLVTKGA